MPTPTPARVTCPQCAATIGQDSGICDSCGYRGDAGAHGQDDALYQTVVRELAHEFDIVDVVLRLESALTLRAVERSSDRAVILKVVRRNGDAVLESKFRSTMETYQKLDHPNILPVVRSGTTDTLLWSVSAEQAAMTLRQRLTSERRIEPRTARRIATQIVSALEYLHRKGLVHGAINADHVLMTDDGFVWLVDSGISRIIPPRRRVMTPASVRVISGATKQVRPHWVAPEDMDSTERRPASDQFSLAALLFECVAGEPPLEPGEHVARFRPEVPVGMSTAIARALDVNPTKRFASCAEFLVALAEEAPPTPPRKPPRAKSARGPKTPTAAQIAVEPPPPTLALEDPPAQPPPMRSASDALLVPDWEPPEDGAQPRHRPVIAAIIVGSVVVVALLAQPALKMIRELREPPMSVGVPVSVSTSPAPPPTEPEALPERPAVASAPTVLQRPAPELPPLPSRSARARGEPPVAPSTIPRPSAAPVESATPEPTTPARLFINASPWGQVFVDGVLVGNTPRANLEVAPGERVIRVVRDGFTPVTRTVRLQPGETIRMTDIVLIPVSP